MIITRVNLLIDSRSNDEQISTCLHRESKIYPLFPFIICYSNKIARDTVALGVEWLHSHRNNSSLPPTNA